MAVLGGYDFEIVREFYDDGVTWTTKNVEHVADHVLTGCVGRLTIEVDGVRHVYEEAGDVENAGQAGTTGARLKLASSDALKRCAMRAGVGLHLWADKSYFLYDYLAHQDEEAEEAAEASPADAPDPKAAIPPEPATEAVTERTAPAPAAVAPTATVEKVERSTEAEFIADAMKMTDKQLRSELTTIGLVAETGTKAARARQLGEFLWQSSPNYSPPTDTGISETITAEDIEAALKTDPESDANPSTEWWGQAFHQTWDQLTDGERMAEGTWLRTHGFPFEDDSTYEWAVGHFRMATGRALRTVDTRP